MKFLRLLFVPLIIIGLTSCITQYTPPKSPASPKPLTQVFDKKEQMARMEQLLTRYEQLSHQPWPRIVLKHDIEPGMQDPRIPMIRRRLIQLGDYYGEASEQQSETYGGALVNAVRYFQRRHGLFVDGIIDAQTMAALNITPAQRMRQIKRNIERWSRLPSKNTDYFIMVNIPSFELNVVQKGHSVVHIKVIVGQPTWPTPELTSDIRTIVLNPSWNVPQDIAEKEIMERVAKDMSYLEFNDIRVVTSWEEDAQEIDPKMINWQKYAGPPKLPYNLVQAPGERNVLGKMKFLFPNRYNVYLHDTPDKRPFSTLQRDLSHGCVRLNRPFDLLTYIVRQEPGLTMGEVRNALDSGETEHINVTNAMPIYMVYLTAWIDENGQIQFRKDIYHKDPI